MNLVKIFVSNNTGAPISGALVKVNNQDKGTTNVDGILEIELSDGTYNIETTVFNIQTNLTDKVIAGPGQVVDLKIDFSAKISFFEASFTDPIAYANQGDIVGLRAEVDQESADAATRNAFKASLVDFSYTWTVSAGTLVLVDSEQQKTPGDTYWHTDNASGKETVGVTVTDPNSNSSVYAEKQLTVLKSTPDEIPVNLRRTQTTQTKDQALWVAIRNRTKAIRFNKDGGYTGFVTKVLCYEDLSDIKSPHDAALKRQQGELYSPIYGVGAYELLKTATQVFLLLECGPVIEARDRHTNEMLYDPDEEESRLGRYMSLNEVQTTLAEYLGGDQLPYIRRVLEAAFKRRDPVNNIFCEGYLTARANCPPMLELIWSYWHEEGMLVQAMNAISLRFQNRRSRADRDPLAHLEIAPLYPLNNLLWGYIQDEMHHLSVPRRNYEYNHHYGLKLHGQAVSDFHPADSRSKFLEAFHNLLHLTTPFYNQEDDTTIFADGFPILNALREVHLILAEGAHNQFGDLPWTARAEMLMQQWLLSRPELREFLHSRAMVPYRESWMPQVDTMKQLQGWTDVSITHFNNLAVYGEQILLSIRYGDWVDVADPTHAANWARYWRPEIQNYIHAYRAATGVDLAAEARDSRQERLRITQPSELLRRRLTSNKAAPALPPPSTTIPQGFRQRRAARRLESGR